MSIQLFSISLPCFLISHFFVNFLSCHDHWEILSSKLKKKIKEDQRIISFFKKTTTILLIYACNFFFWSVNTYLLRAQSRSGTRLDTGNISIIKTRQKFCTQQKLYFTEENVNLMYQNLATRYQKAYKYNLIKGKLLFRILNLEVCRHWNSL